MGSAVAEVISGVFLNEFTKTGSFACAEASTNTNASNQH